MRFFIEAVAMNNQERWILDAIAGRCVAIADCNAEIERCLADMQPYGELTARVTTLESEIVALNSYLDIVRGGGVVDELDLARFE